MMVKCAANYSVEGYIPILVILTVMTSKTVTGSNSSICPRSLVNLLNIWPEDTGQDGVNTVHLDLILDMFYC